MNQTPSSIRIAQPCSMCKGDKPISIQLPNNLNLCKDCKNRISTAGVIFE